MGFLGLTWCRDPQIKNFKTVAAYLAGKSGYDRAAVTQTPSTSNEGIMTFFDPQVICRVTDGSSKEVLNESMLLHEALHGLLGSDDVTLELLLGVRTSVGITYYFQSNIWQQSLLYLNDSPDSQGPLQCPN